MPDQAHCTPAGLRRGRLACLQPPLQGAALLSSFLCSLPRGFQLLGSRRGRATRLRCRSRLLGQLAAQRRELLSAPDQARRRTCSGASASSCILLFAHWSAAVSSLPLIE